MEITRRYLARHPTGFAAYLALEVALMRRFVARGGSEEEFCRRLAPAFHRRFAPLLLGCVVVPERVRTVRSAARRATARAGTPLDLAPAA